MTIAVAPNALPIPGSHLDLLTRAVHGVLTTVGGDGQPQSSLVWVDVDSACALVNTTLQRQKGRNLVANPKVSLLVVIQTTRHALSKSAVTPNSSQMVPSNTSMG